VKDEAFALPIANAITPFVMRSTVRDFGLKIGLAAAPLYEDVWLA